MADEENQDQAAEDEKKGGKGKLIIIGVAVVVLGVGGFFGYKMMNPPPEEDAAAEEMQPASKPALFASLHPPLVINFEDQYGEAHFMQMTLEVMAREQKIVDHVKNHAAVIRNSLILMFSNVDYETVATREGKQQMLDEALVEIQDIVMKETGDEGVEAVYFTGLIIQ